jgi:hypothetical protein
LLFLDDALQGIKIAHQLEITKTMQHRLHRAALHLPLLSQERGIS